MSVSIEQLKSMNEDEYQLIDMRNESEIAHGEIPGAIVIQADEIENSELVDKSKKLIICCSRGQNSIEVAENLVEKGYEVVNYGTDSYESCPYPKYGEKIGKAVADGEVDLGVAICGTGLGISMAANKVHGVRAAVCSEPYTAKMAREHNNANVIAFGARVIGIEMAKMILDTFLGAEFLGGRHQDRVDMIMAIEENQ